MRNLSAAKSYAAAIFGLAVAQQRVRPVMQDIEKLSGALTSDPGIFSFFKNPTVRPDKKDRILGEVAPRLEVSQECVGLCKVMIANGRMALLPDVTGEFRRMLDEFEGRTEAWVTAARELLPAEEEQIRNALSQLTRKSVSLHTSVEKSLIGGVIVRIGNTVINSSVRGRLRAFAEKME